MKCHSFKWYLDNVFPEKFVLDENVYAYGEVRKLSIKSSAFVVFFFFQLRNPGTSLCLDTLGKDESANIPVAIYSCQNGVSANQYFSLSKNDELRREDACCISTGSPVVSLADCDFAGANHKWKHEKVLT